MVSDCFNSINHNWVQVLNYSKYSLLLTSSQYWTCTLLMISLRSTLTKYIYPLHYMYIYIYIYHGRFFLYQKSSLFILITNVILNSNEQPCLSYSSVTNDWPERGVLLMTSLLNWVGAICQPVSISFPFHNV